MAHDPGEFRELAPYGNAPDEASPRGRRGSSARVRSDVPEMRPRRIGELLDVATEVFCGRFALYVGISALLWLPVYAVRPLLVPEELARDASRTGELFLGFFVTMLAMLVVTALVSAIIARLVASELGGGAVSVGAALRGVLARSLSIAVLAAVNGLATLGFACFCLPGFFLLFKVWLAPAVCVIEDVGVAKSLERSVHLSRERFGSWLGIFVTATVLLVPFSWMAGLLDYPGFRDSALRRLGLSRFEYDVARIAFSALFTGVATAYRGVLVTVWYFDGLVRRDGADLAARLERLRTAGGA